MGGGGLCTCVCAVGPLSCSRVLPAPGLRRLLQGPPISCSRALPKSPASPRGTSAGTKSMGRTRPDGAVFGQNVTATRSAPCTTAATRPATVNAKKAPRGPSVMTACPTTTGGKAASVSTPTAPRASNLSQGQQEEGPGTGGSPAPPARLPRDAQAVG